MKTPIAALLSILLLTTSAYAQVTPNNIPELLAAQNAYRAPLNLPPLQWSLRLAAQAQAWAEHLAQIGTLQHSGPGQNLAMGTAGAFSLTQLVDLWGHEQRYFHNGNFPDISTTGNWADVGHYSQLIWATTTQVGCGYAENHGQAFLVCDYNPPGNVMGQPVY